MKRWLVTTLAALTASASLAGAVRVVGTAPPWVGEVAGQPVKFRQLDTGGALSELYAGRADVALVSLPGPPPPPGTGRTVMLPVGVYAVRLAYRLPGIDVHLDVRTACRIFAGQVTVWNDPELVALNPGEELPALPIITTARIVPNAASRVLADACVAGLWWPRRWAKSHWAANAVQVRATRAEQHADLRLTGSFAVLGPLEQVDGVQVARVRTAGGSFARPAAALGLSGWTGLPRDVRGALPPADEPDAYPLRGLVWAVVLREQRYRERALEDMTALGAFLRELRSGGNTWFAPLPYPFRPVVRLVYGGRSVLLELSPAAP